ncbi:hypothetical protein [Methylotuvimicrobium sp. KM1]|uniref:hypothetical protein n=1 Tax=Methylotuvimicrobium sp. KM1 TaxID=3377707 RepID=UPI003850FD22
MDYETIQYSYHKQLSNDKRTSIILPINTRHLMKLLFLAKRFLSAKDLVANNFLILRKVWLLDWQVSAAGSRRQAPMDGFTAFLDRHTPHPEHGEISQTGNCCIHAILGNQSPPSSLHGRIHRVLPSKLPNPQQSA